MNVKLISMTKNPFDTVAAAASVCYDSEPSFNIVKGCYLSGHESVLEHMSFTFELSGVSRALLAQLTRHRLASFSVRSQRYCKENNPQYVQPNTTKDGGTRDLAFYNAMLASWEFYNQLLSLKVPAEDARMVLTNACETIIYITVNLRELIHICNERLCTRAQWEIRECVQKMKDCVLLSDEFTDEQKDFLQNRMLVPKCEAGKVIMCPEHKGCGKHITAGEVKKAVDFYNFIQNEYNFDLDAVKNILSDVHENYE